MTPREGFALASQHFGSDLKLAMAIGFSPNAVWKARKRGLATAEMSASIEAATNGLVKRETLRPDIFGARVEIGGLRGAPRDRMRAR